MALFDIPRNDRVALMGMTKSGKTYLARAILASAPRLVALDPKGLLYNRSDWNLEHWDAGIDRLEAGKDARLWIPPPTSDGEYEEWLQKIMRLRDVVIYIDEMYGVGPPQGSKGLRALYTRGRELGLGVWGCFQRPRNIPIYAMSEAEWLICFRLEQLDDRKYMAERMGRVALQRLTDHACIIYHDGRSVLITNGIKLIKRKALTKERM